MLYIHQNIYTTKCSVALCSCCESRKQGQTRVHRKKVKGKKPFANYRTCRTWHARRQIISKFSKHMLGDATISLRRRRQMKDFRSKITHNGKRKVNLLVSFHIFDSLVGRVLVKLIKCLEKARFSRVKSKIELAG